MKSFLSLVILSMSFSAFSQEMAKPVAPLSKADFSQYNPKPTVVNGLNLPRLGPLLYRGFDPNYFKHFKIIQGLLGNPGHGLRAKTTWQLEGRYLSEGKEKMEALQLAIDEVDGLFKGEYAKRILDHSRYDYNDWPSDILFFSVYPQASFGYPLYHAGPGSVLVVQDKKMRGADINHIAFAGKNDYWMTQGGQWFGYDSGEVILPTYVPPSDFEGLLIGTGGPQTTIKITEAYYKVKEGDKTFVLRMDTKAQPECFLKNLTNGKIHLCKNNFKDTDKFPKFPTQDNQAKACAVFVVCDKDKALECGITPEFKAKHLLNTKCTGEASVRVNDIGWDDVKVKYFKHED